jgi:hypothetical protein
MDHGTIHIVPGTIVVSEQDNAAWDKRMGGRRRLGKLDFLFEEAERERAADC